MRSLYLDVHKDEFTDSELATLDWYHNLNEVHDYVVGENYEDYFTYILTRDPYSRVVSAFLDQYVYSRNAQVKKMLSEHPHKSNQEPQNFIEFLEYLKTVPDAQRDPHFQTQSFASFAVQIVTPANFIYRLAGRVRPGEFGVNYMGDISGFNRHSKKLFKRVFKQDKSKYEFAMSKLGEAKKQNSTFYGEQDFDNAALLTLNELDGLTFSPKPQDFYTDQGVVDLVNEIYQDDFKWFNYSMGKTPSKSASSQIGLVPDDFDWQHYVRLNPDLAKDEFYNERSVVRHYLEFGRFELFPRAYKTVAPEGFDWEKYLSLHPDLGRSGITTEKAAIEHYLFYGIREGRAI